MVGVIAIYFCLPKFTHYLFELENWSILLKGSNWHKTNEACWGQEGHWKKNHWLGAGFKYFLFSPRTVGKKIHFNEYVSRAGGWNQQLVEFWSPLPIHSSTGFISRLKKKSQSQGATRNPWKIQAFCACLSELLGTLASWSRPYMAPAVFCWGERVEWTTGTGWFCMLLLENF